MSWASVHFITFRAFVAQLLLIKVVTLEVFNNEGGKKMQWVVTRLLGSTKIENWGGGLFF